MKVFKEVVTKEWIPFDDIRIDEVAIEANRIDDSVFSFIKSINNHKGCLEVCLNDDFNKGDNHIIGHILNVFYVAWYYQNEYEVHLFLNGVKL